MENTLNVVLIEISTKLNQQKLNWAVGASVMLNLRGIEIQPHDIDLMVESEHFLSAHACLITFCEEVIVEPSRSFKTKEFKRYTYKGIEIDLMTGMGIVHDMGLFDYQFSYQDIETKLNRFNVLIPLCFVEDWWVFYHLMTKRDRTISLIREYFNTHLIKKNRLSRCLVLLPETSIVRCTIQEIL